MEHKDCSATSYTRQGWLQARLGQSHQPWKLLGITTQPLPTSDCPPRENFFHARGWNFLWCNLWPFHSQCSPLTKGWLHLLYKLWLGWCRCQDPSQPSPLQAEQVEPSLPVLWSVVLHPSTILESPYSLSKPLLIRGARKKTRCSSHPSQLTQISRTCFPVHWGSHVKVLDGCKYKLSFKPWQCSTAEALTDLETPQERKVIHHSHRDFKKCPAITTRFLPLSTGWRIILHLFQQLLTFTSENRQVKKITKLYVFNEKTVIHNVQFTRPAGPSATCCCKEVQETLSLTNLHNAVPSLKQHTFALFRSTLKHVPGTFDYPFLFKKYFLCGIWLFARLCHSSSSLFSGIFYTSLMACLSFFLTDLFQILNYFCWSPWHPIKCCNVFSEIRQRAPKGCVL